MTIAQLRNAAAALLAHAASAVVAVAERVAAPTAAPVAKPAPAMPAGFTAPAQVRPAAPPEPAWSLYVTDSPSGALACGPARGRPQTGRATTLVDGQRVVIDVLDTKQIDSQRWMLTVKFGPIATAMGARPAFGMRIEAA